MIGSIMENNGNSDLDREYTPMAWGAGAADDNNDIEIIKVSTNLHMYLDSMNLMTVMDNLVNTEICV